jgi:hypothetical protein
MLAIGPTMPRPSFQSTRRNVRFYSHLELDCPALAGVHGLQQLVDSRKLAALFAREQPASQATP